MERLLIVDDEPQIRALVEDFFGEEMEVVAAGTAAEATALAREKRPQAALVDINLPGTSGIALMKELKRVDPAVAVIIMTGSRTAQNAIEAMRAGAYDYITKPLDFTRLHEALSRAFASYALSRKVRYLAAPAEEVEETEDAMIGSSPEMIEIWKMVGTVAESDATVLIQGESGTGKELLARAVYDNSRRRNKPFLAVNCAALPEQLLESELFGHEKGAFTDAVGRRIGKFEQCDGGTIFLDEVGEMSPSSQGKLLRVLENQEFQRLGGNATIKVDVRIIAATNRSLVSAVKEKQFRMDLFYRLRVVSFFLPPLRERVEDIPLLVDLFIRRFSYKYAKDIGGIAPEALDLLLAQQWEGNIRELKNTINSAVLMTKNRLLQPMDFDFLPPAQPRPAEAVPAPDDLNAAFVNMLGPHFDRIVLRNRGNVFEAVEAALERTLVNLALRKCEGNQVAAAKLLGISRNTLRDRIDRYRAPAPVEGE